MSEAKPSASPNDLELAQMLRDGLEQQCEEIRSKRRRSDESEFDWHDQHIDILFAYIDELRGDIYAHSQDDGKLEREIVRLQEQLAELRTTLACRDNDVLSLTLQRDEAKRQVEELSRPSDAKEIAQIQVSQKGRNHTIHVHGELSLTSIEGLEATKQLDVLLRALAESQRECARLNSCIDRAGALAMRRTTRPPVEELQTGLETRIFDLLDFALITYDQNQLIRKELQALQDEIARMQQERLIVWELERKEILSQLSARKAEIARLTTANQELSTQVANLLSPPEERRDIARRQEKRHRDLANNQYVTIVDAYQTVLDADTLLQDCARYRNAHHVLMVERDAARDTAKDWHQTAIERAERITALEANNAELTIANEAIHGTMGQRSEQPSLLLTGAQERLEAALQLFAPYFRSGNSIPVERAVIRADSDAVRAMNRALTAADGQEPETLRESVDRMRAKLPALSTLTCSCKRSSDVCEYPKCEADNESLIAQLRDNIGELIGENNDYMERCSEKDAQIAQLLSALRHLQQHADSESDRRVAAQAIAAVDIISPDRSGRAWRRVMTEPVRREFILPTGGKEPGIDAIAIAIEILGALKPNEVKAFLVYINSRFERGYDAAVAERRHVAPVGQEGQKS